MPITASLGALTYPRIYDNAVLPSGLGFGTLIPGYQFINSQYGFLKSDPTGNTTEAYTNGIGVDSDGNLYLAGVNPGVGFPDLIEPQAGIFKLNASNGSAIYDTVPFNGAGIATTVNNSNKAVHAIGYWYAGWSPVTIQDRGYQTSGNNFTNYYLFGQYTTTGYELIYGLKTDGVGNYYYCISNGSDSLAIAKTDSNNQFLTSVSIKRNPFGTLPFKDFAIDANQNIYILTSFTTGIGILTKFSYSGGSYSLTWRKQFNYEANAIAVNTSNIFVMVSTTSSYGSLVKLDLNGDVVSQKEYYMSIDYRYARLSIGSDGNLYSQSPFASWDTNLNLRWCNTVGYQAKLTGYTGPTGNAGIEEKNGYVYAASTIGYNASRCIFAFKVPSDGTVISPGKYWLGDGYMFMNESSLTEYNISTVTTTNTTYVISGTFGPATNTTTSDTNAIPEDDMCINVGI